MTRIFHWFFMWKMDPMSGCDIRLVFYFPPRDSTLQYKRCVHLWNNFPCIKQSSSSTVVNIFGFLGSGYLIVRSRYIVKWLYSTLELNIPSFLNKKYIRGSLVLAGGNTVYKSRDAWFWRSWQLKCKVL